MVMNRERIQRDLNRVKQRLEMYYQAEEAILGGAQSYQIGSRQLTRASLPYLQDEIAKLENKRDEMENMLTACDGPRRSFRVIPRDL
jgi:hypothetical protein